MTTLMNDANNAGTLLPCPFCQGDALMLKDHKRLGFYIAFTVCHACGQTDLKPTVIERWNTRTLSTPNAPVEPAGLRSLRHLLAHMPDKDLHLRRFDAQQLLQFIDAILAVRLDEAAIRKDEREKQREIDAKIAEHDDRWGEWSKFVVRQQMVPVTAMQVAIASAIRNGGRRP